MTSRDDIERLASAVDLPVERTEVVAVSLSRYLTDRKAPLANGSPYLMKALADYAATDLPDVAPISVEGAQDARRPTPSSVLKRHGYSPEQVRSEYLEQQQRHGERVTLRPELLVELIPTPFWRVVDLLVEEGPAVAGRRIEALLDREVQRELPATRARPDGGPVSQAHLNNLSSQIRRLLEVLVEIRTREVVPSLDQWVVRPQLKFVRAKVEEATDSTSPPLTLLRYVLQELNSEITGILRCPSAEQADCIRAGLSSRQMTGLFLRLRSRALLSSLATVGMRVGALTRLTVDDLSRTRPRNSGELGSALALRPGKSLSAEKVRFKPIPEGLLDVIEAHLAFLELYFDCPLPGDNPLFMASLTRPTVALSSHAIGNQVGRSQRRTHRLKDGRTSEYVSPPLLPRTGSENGYSAHTVRGAVAQMIRSRAGACWLELNRDHLGDERLAADPLLQSMLADVLLDHSVSLDLLGYGGASKERDRERLSGIATELTWALLSTDAGARKVPDAKGFRAAVHQRLAAESELARVTREIDEILEASRNGMKSDAALIEIQARTHREKRVREQLGEIKIEINEIRHNRARQVPIPDDQPLVCVDLDQIEKELAGGVGGYERRRYKAVRDWITPGELAQILGVGSATVRRWLDGRLPRHIVPWDVENLPIDDSLGHKRRRLIAGGLNQALFDTELKREKLAETLARWPKGWTQEGMQTPLDRSNNQPSSDQ